MKYHNQLRYALAVTGQYRGDIPLASFLKQFFRERPQMGSSDRRVVAELAYNFCRLGHAFANIEPQEKMLAGMFLCQSRYVQVLEHLKPAWYAQRDLPLADKLTLLGEEWQTGQPSLAGVFPWQHLLSDGIDGGVFNISFLTQPLLFLRARPGAEDVVAHKLSAAGIPFEKRTPSCFALANNSKVDTVLGLDREAVVQDANSQQTGRFIRDALQDLATPHAWDLCAASGGKSLLAFDSHPQVRLTVTDIRASILQNLQKRFAVAGISKYKALVADLSKSSASALISEVGQPDVIIADVPCTGSGTWARTPEQLCFFSPEKIAQYNSLQQKILANGVPHLKKGGSLVYITCSVFRQENEAVVEYLLAHHDLELASMEVLAGYNSRADTLFAARLISRS